MVGAVAAGERSSRAIASAGVRAAGVAMRPAGVWWRSPLGAPVRSRVAAASDALERSGRELVARTSDQARVSGSRELKRLGDQLSESGLADEIIDKLLSSGAFDRIVTVVINHPATEALVVNVVDEPALERLVSRVMDSRLVDGVTAQLLASDEMQMILDYVTRSPELRAALAHQTAGMAEDVAVGCQVADVQRRCGGRALRASPAQASIQTRATAVTEEPQIHIGYAGLVTRAVAVGIDLLVINGIAVITGALINLIASFFGATTHLLPWRRCSAGPRGSRGRRSTSRSSGPSRVRRLETG